MEKIFRRAPNNFPLCIGCGEKMSLSLFVQEERAATAIEYGLIASVFAVLCLAGATGLSGAMTTMYNKIRDDVIAALS